MSNDNFKLTNLLKEIEECYSYSELCKMTSTQKSEYKQLYQVLCETNGNKNYSNAEKGKALENITTYLMKITGNIFQVRENLRTTTNEIDVVIEPKQSAKLLISNNLINSLYDTFIGECKNYNKSVDVTYIGKFCSLLLSTEIKLGLLFSYHGVSGAGWSNGSGLIKKFYLHKEKKMDRYCIIDFNINDFARIKNGDNLFQIVDEKLLSLQLDTDYAKYISVHPAERAQ